MMMVSGCSLGSRLPPRLGRSLCAPPAGSTLLLPSRSRRAAATGPGAGNMHMTAALPAANPPRPTAVVLVDPTPQTLAAAYNNSLQPAVYSMPWGGLLAALALAATALIAAAAAAFLLYLRPLLQAMSVTLAEMEAAAKEMQEAALQVEATAQLLQSNVPGTMAAVSGAASEVQELAGSINNAARLLTPTRLLKLNSSTADRSSRGTAAAGAADSEHNSSEKQQVLGSVADGSLQGLLEGLRSLSGLQMPAGIAELWSSLEEDSSSSSSSNLAAGPAGSETLAQPAGKQQPGALNSSSSSRTVWDALALSLSSPASRRSLTRLRADLAAAANVLSVLLQPASSKVVETLRAAVTLAPGLEEQRQQQQQVLQLLQEADEVLPEQQLLGRLQDQSQVVAADSELTNTTTVSTTVKPAAAAEGASAAMSTAALPQQAGAAAAARRTRAQRASSSPAAPSQPQQQLQRPMGSSPSSSSRRRRVIEEDEWGLPIVLEAAGDDDFDAEAAGRAATVDSITELQQHLHGSAPAARISAVTAAAAAAAHKNSLPSDNSDDEQQTMTTDNSSQTSTSTSSGGSCVGAGARSLEDLSTYVSFQDVHMDGTRDDGITWQQLQGDAALRSRVFCDNQEAAFQGLSAQQHQHQHQHQETQPDRTRQL